MIRVEISTLQELVAIGCAMVEAINSIGHVMGMSTIAEFSETEAILIKLRELGVDYAQGYAIGKPQPLESIVACQQTTPLA